MNRKAEEITYLDTAAVFARLEQGLDNNEAFMHLRFNDGEFDCMFGLKPPEATTSGEHHHLPDLGQELLSVFGQACLQSQINPHGYLIGSCWFRLAEHPWSRAAHDYLIKNRFDPSHIPWCIGDFWYETEAEVAGRSNGKELLSLLDTLGRTAKRRPVVLVGNNRIAGAANCLGWNFIEIPAVDAWLQRDHILACCDQFSEQDAVFVWAAGLPGKVFSWWTWSKFPGTFHIDTGHLFDGIYGVYNRGWLTRQRGPHWDFLQQELIPYLRKKAP